jgi:hypothetical protein
MSENNSSTTFLAFLMGILVIVGLTIGMSAAWGLVLYKFWYWFLQPLFPVRSITYIEAITLEMSLSVFKTHTTTRIKKEYRNDEDWEAFIAPFITLAVGWVIKVVFL